MKRDPTLQGHLYDFAFTCTLYTYDGRDLEFRDSISFIDELTDPPLFDPAVGYS